VKFSGFITLLLVLAGCGPRDRIVDVPFLVHWHGQVLSCGSGPVELTDLRFFVSEVRIGAQNRSYPAAIVDDGRWQNANVALIDLEDGQGACRNGSGEMNSVLRLKFAEGAERGLSFSLGVPPALNHANPLTAASPLNSSVMHWHWRSGYKFLRAGIQTSDDGFWMHLGSSGCKGTIGNIEGCDAPNRAVIRIEDFELGKHAVIVDLGRLFGDVDVSDASPTRCMSAPDEQSCRAPFTALGLTASVPTASVFQLGTRQ
jgi:uncharacterized repeat protein (TIGR04052 family)